MFEIKTVHEIKASVENVWSTLMDFDSYSEWNPFVVSAHRVGNQLNIRINPPNEKSRSFSSKILNIIENTELRWVGIAGSQYLFRGEHSFELQEIAPNKTRLIHREVFSGILTCFIGKKTRANIQHGFELMNQALSNRAEEFKSKESV